MKRIYLRGYKDPFYAASPKEVYRRNLIGDNLGNLLFSNASYKLLATEGVEITVGPLTGGKAEADRLNAEFDHVVVPLANAFRLSYAPQLRQLTQTISALRIPATVLGVGAQMALSGDPARLDPIRQDVVDFVAATLDHSPSIGVRGQFTHAYLRGLGFGQIEQIGCPSLFMRGPHLRVRRSPGPLPQDARVSLNLSPYVSGLTELVSQNTRSYPNLRYTAQHREALGMLLHTNAPEPESAAQRALPTVRSHELVASGRTSFFVDPQPWLSYLSQFQFSFGTRIHGNIAAILAGVPAYVLAHDSRTQELARYHDIPHRTVKALGADLDAASLYEQADYAAFNAGQAARFATFSNFLHAHDLAHTYDRGQDCDAFERRAAELTYPGDVGLLSPSREFNVRRMARALLHR